MPEDPGERAAKTHQRIVTIVIAAVVIGIGVWSVSPLGNRHIMRGGYPAWFLGVGVPTGITIIYLIIRDWRADRGSRGDDGQS